MPVEAPVTMANLRISDAILLSSVQGFMTTLMQIAKQPAGECPHSFDAFSALGLERSQLEN
jgi:hypothetical protein